MTASAWDQPLDTAQSLDILRQLSLFTFAQHHDDKLCFYPTKIILEGNSKVLRGGAEWMNFGIQKLWTGTEPETSRNLEKLKELINKVHSCLAERDIRALHYVKDSSEKQYVWIDLIKEAKEGLICLIQNQYSTNTPKKVIIEQAIEKLTETERLFNTDVFEIELVLKKLPAEDAAILLRLVRRKEERIRSLEQQAQRPFEIKLE
jgi:hypothetical protein